MLPRLKPRKFYDLVIEVAIVRPGPIQGDMVHPYLRRRQGKEKPEYPKPELEAILSKTLGVPLFQEQAMRIAIEAGGFSPGEADQLRRAMATFKRTGTIGNYRQRMIEGMVRRGYERDFAERCFKQIEGFGEYGFPESHAAAFALLVYASCWFKALLSRRLLRGDPQLPADGLLPAGAAGARRAAIMASRSGRRRQSFRLGLHAGGSVLRPAPHRTNGMRKCATSSGPATPSGSAFGRSRGFQTSECKSSSPGAAKAMNRCAMSGCAPASMSTRSSGWPQADAFRSLGLDRREALWAVRALDGKSAAERLPLFDRPNARLRDNEPETRLPRMPLGEHVIHDYRSLGLSLKAHPLAFLRERLDRIGVTPNARLTSVPDGSRVSVAGLVLVRQRPGKGNAIFLTLEDEKGIANIIVWARMFERFRPIIMGAKFVRVSGALQSRIGRDPYRCRKLRGPDALARRSLGRQLGLLPSRKKSNCPS